MARKKTDTRLPGLHLPSGVGGELLSFLSGVKETLDSLTGVAGDPNARVPTIAELENVGVVRSVVRNKYAELRGGEKLGTEQKYRRTIYRTDTGEVVPTGPQGAAIVELRQYKRDVTTPTTPAAGSASFDFSTRVLTPTTGWSASIPSGSYPVYITTGIAYANTWDGIDNDIVWSTPVKSLEDGQAVDIVFKRAPGDPGTPLPSVGVPSGWYTNVADVPITTDPMWSCVGTRSAIQDNWVWQQPVQLEGTGGAPGEPGPAGTDGSPVDLTPTSDWVIPITDPMGDWDMIGGSISKCQVLNNVPGPYDGYPLLLRILGDGTPNASWNGLWKRPFTVNANRGYISFVWVKKIGAATTRGYVGWTQNVSGAIESAVAPYDAETNPYTVANFGGTMTDGEWYLVVSVIHPAGSTGGDLGIAGMYDPVTGVKLLDGGEYRHGGTGVIEQFPRWGFFDGNNAFTTGQGFDFVPAGTYVMDGTEPSISKILNRVRIDDFANSIQPVSISIGVPGSYVSDVVFNISDGKLYRWTGATYVASVATTDLSGQITNSQIASLDVGKLTAGILNAAITLTEVLVLSTNGRVYTLGKTSAANAAAGIFMGHDGSSSYDLAVGTGNPATGAGVGFIWDGSAGTFTIYGALIATSNLVANAATLVNTSVDTQFDLTANSTFQTTTSQLTTDDPCDSSLAVCYCEGTANAYASGSRTAKLRLRIYDYDTTTTTYSTESNTVTLNDVDSELIRFTVPVTLNPAHRYQFTIEGWHSSRDTNVGNWEFTDVTLNMVVYKR